MSNTLSRQNTIASNHWVHGKSWNIHRNLTANSRPKSLNNVGYNSKALSSNVNFKMKQRPFLTWGIY